MRSTETQGIVAKYAGTCELCGQNFEAGNRIFHLPDNRRGASQDPWVCAKCRYPQADEIPTMAEIMTKISYRLSTPGKTLSLNRKETIVLHKFIDYFIEEDYWERRELQDTQAYTKIEGSAYHGKPTNFGTRDALTILDALTAYEAITNPTFKTWQLSERGQEIAAELRISSTDNVS